MSIGAEGMFMHPDGKHVLVGVANEDKVVEIDLAQMKVIRQLKGFKGPAYLDGLEKKSGRFFPVNLQMKIKFYMLLKKPWYAQMLLILNPNIRT